MIGWLKRLFRTRRRGDSTPAGETSVEVYDRMRQHDPLTQAITQVAYGQAYEDWWERETQRDPVRPADFLVPREMPEPGLSPREFLEKHPGRGLVVGGGVSLRYLKEILLKPEHERTDHERSILLARPEVTDVAAIDRQLRAMRLPTERNRIRGEIPGFTAVETSEHGLELDGTPKEITDGT